jgi:SAM-dependent methyltransferase
MRSLNALFKQSALRSDHPSLDTYMAKRYAFGPQRFIHTRELAIVDNLLEKAGGTFHRLLDSPCGYGRLTELLAGRCTHLVSSDLSPLRVLHHSHYFNSTGSYAHIVNSNAGALPFKDSTFDGVVTFRLFHHLRDEELRKKIFTEAARVSRNFLLISFYEKNPLHEFSRKMNMNKDIRKGRKVFLVPDIIMEEAARAGWSHVESCPVLAGFHAQTVVLFKK